MSEVKNIKLIVTDFDGVLTDNKVHVSQDGIESVVCNRSDGLAVELLREKSVNVVVLSKERNPVVQSRCEKLKIPCYSGIDKKLDIFKKIIDEAGVEKSMVCYVGNEVNDLECIRYADVSFAPCDAHPSVLEAVTNRINAKGGDGVLREIADLIL